MDLLMLLGALGFFALLVVGVVVVVVVVLSTSKRPSTPANPNLFPCPDCGRQVSRMATSCPNCGRPLASDGQT